MGLTVFAQVTPPLVDLAEKGAFIPVTQGSLVKEIGLWLQSGSKDCAQQGRAVFLRELTVEAVAPVIQGILQDTSPRKALTLSWEGQLKRLLNSQLPLVISA